MQCCARSVWLHPAPLRWTGPSWWHLEQAGAMGLLSQLRCLSMSKPAWSSVSGHGGLQPPEPWTSQAPSLLHPSAASPCPALSPARQPCSPRFPSQLKTDTKALLQAVPAPAGPQHGALPNLGGFMAVETPQPWAWAAVGHPVVPQRAVDTSLPAMPAWLGVRQRDGGLQQLGDPDGMAECSPTIHSSWQRFSGTAWHGDLAWWGWCSPLCCWSWLSGPHGFMLCQQPAQPARELMGWLQ